MCDHCGCDSGQYTEHAHHVHHHSHHGTEEEPHSHDSKGLRIQIETDILGKNNLLAQRNRGFFEGRKIWACNLVSSPGSGKTTLLEQTLKRLHEVPVYVIEGDQQTSLDAERIQSAGIPVIQVNTGNGCHLDAEMIQKAVKTLDPASGSLVFIENVGNLVCPALFDLGENKRVVIISVTEGDDKPLKYPNMFESAHLCLINKTDLLPYVDFNMERCISNAQKVNPKLQFIAISAKTGDGFPEWLQWVERFVMNNGQ